MLETGRTRIKKVSEENCQSSHILRGILRVLRKSSRFQVDVSGLLEKGQQKLRRETRKSRDLSRFQDISRYFK